MVAVSLLGAGCSQATKSIQTPPVEQKNSVQVPPAIPTPAPQKPTSSLPTPAPTTSIANACDVITTDIVKAKLGATFSAGETQASSMKGTTCILKHPKSITARIIVQLSENGATYYMSESLYKNAKQLGIGEKGIYTYTDQKYGGTTSFVQFIKNGKLGSLDIISPEKFTEQQLKDLINVVAQAL